MGNLNYQFNTRRPARLDASAHNARRSRTSVLGLAILSLIMLLGFRVEATHYMGGQQTVTWVTGNSYRLNVTVYRDCNGVTMAANSPITVSPAVAGNPSSLPRVRFTDITPLCPGQVSRCQTGFNIAYGVEEHVYEGIFNLPPTANSVNYSISSSLAARNGAINTVVNAGGQNMFLFTSFNANLVPQNNSPRFLNLPIGFFCANQPAVLSPNGFDPDGDAIVYSLTACRDANANDPLTYAAGYSASNPLSSSTPITIDPNTGLLSFTPTTVGQVAVICVRADEYRGGVKIGEVVRDIQVRILNCSNTPPVIAPISNVILPVGTPYCVNISATDANNHNITLSAVSGIIPPATFTLGSSGAGFANGTFCFTPTSIHEGNTFTVTINAQDNGCPSTATGVTSFNITVPIVCRAEATASSTNATCGQSNGTASAFMSGGIPPYQLSWAGPNGFSGFGTTVSGLAAGDYFVTIVDGNSCVAYDTVTVGTSGSNATVSAIVSDANCGQNNGTVTVSTSGGTAPFTYSLNGGASQASNVFSNLGQGVYTILVTDANGCQVSGSAVVGLAQDLTAPIISCPGNIVVGNDAGLCGANVSFANATATDDCGVPAVVQVSGGASGSFFAVGAASTVSFTAVDGSGNTASCSFTVSVSDLENPVAVCQSQTVNIGSTGSASFTAAQFDGGSTDNCGIASISAGPLAFTCSDLGTNTITLTVVDVNGNTASTSCQVTVTNDPLSVSLSTNSFNCGYNVSCNGATDGNAGSAVSGGCEPYTYAWSNGGTNGSLSGLGAGSYSLVVTDANGNSANASITLTEPAALTVSVSGSDVSCNGGSNGSASSATSGGCAPYNYAWSNGGNGSSLSGLAAGTYSVVVTDANGCSATASYTVSQPSALVVTTGPNQSVNYGYGSNCATLTQTTTGGTPGYTGVWTDNNNNVVGTSVCPSVTTTYCYTATDANGCTATACMTVCVLDIRCVGTSNNGNNGGNTGGQGGQGWMNGGAPQHVTICHTPPGRPGTSWIMCVPPSAVPSHLAHGDYLGACGVGGSNANCNGNKAAEASATAAPKTLAMETFPNPTSGALKVMLNCDACNDGEIDLQVVDALGKLVSRNTVTMSGGKAMSEFNIANQGAGFYFIIASDGNSRVIEKVVKN